MKKKNKNLVERLKSKNLLWYTGVLIVLISLFGICYGIWVCYNGILIKNVTDQELLDLLNQNTMTIQDGVYALIGFGTVIIIYYLFVLILGLIGILLSGHFLVKQTLFWITIVLLSVSIILGFLGILSWTIAIITILVLALFGFAIFRKYNLDITTIEKKKREKEWS